MRFLEAAGKMPACGNYTMNADHMKALIADWTQGFKDLVELRDEGDEAPKWGRCDDATEAFLMTLLSALPEVKP